MNLMLKIAMLSGVSLAAFGTAGCKITECTENLPDGGTTKKENCVQLQPTVEYRDARLRTGAQPWTKGRAVSITNNNGPLKVALGSSGDERVQFTGAAFTRETDNAEGAQKAKDHLSTMADPVLSSDFSLVAPGGGINGYDPVDGYDLTVWLPSDFDAALTLVAKNGTTTLYGADETASTTISSHEIKASNLRGSINLTSKVGDIDVSGVPSGRDNVIRAELGDILTTLGAANLAITATTSGQSARDIVTFPTAWTQKVADDKKSGTATVGDGSGILTVTSGNGSITFVAQ